MYQYHIIHVFFLLLSPNLLVFNFKDCKFLKKITSEQIPIVPDDILRHYKYYEYYNL